MESIAVSGEKTKWARKKNAENRRVPAKATMIHFRADLFWKKTSMHTILYANIKPTKEIAMVHFMVVNIFKDAPSRKSKKEWA